MKNLKKVIKLVGVLIEGCVFRRRKGRIAYPVITIFKRKRLKMEILLWIAGIFGVIWLVGAYLTNKNVSRYSYAINSAVNFMDSGNYKDTEIYKSRLNALKEQGWSETSLNLLTEIRTLMVREHGVNASFFSRPDVTNLEHLFLMKYAVAHGYAEQFQNSMVLGKQIEDMLAGR